jgi:hypothetical protein
MTGTYLNASAIVKLAVREPHSDAPWRYLRGRRPLLSSALARTEVPRSVLPDTIKLWSAAAADRLSVPALRSEMGLRTM